MTAKVGVLLVHGIGAQKPGSLIQDWAVPLQQEIGRILADQGRNSNEADGLHFREYLWDPHVRAFSGLAVTAWVLMNLPRIAAIHAALGYQARPGSHEGSDNVGAVCRQFISRIWVYAWRGSLTPALLTPLICILWIVDPPIVLITGLLSFLHSGAWRRSIPHWRPFSPASFLMARIIGDAYIWLASPLGRLLSRGSRQALIDGFNDQLEELYKCCSRVVVVAHSQGAAIAIAALEREEKLPKNTHLVTVGGGHRLLRGIEATRLWGYNNGFTREGGGLFYPTALYATIGGLILVQAVYFQWLYIGSLLWWFVITPLWLVVRALTSLKGIDVTALGSERSELFHVLIERLLWAVHFLTLTLILTCFVTVGLAVMHRVGRPQMREFKLPCGWTEVWSRFDPVCVGPPVDLATPRDGTVSACKRPRAADAAAFETWTLKRGWPLVEHTSYFHPRSSSLRVIAMTLAWQLNSSPVAVTLPGQASTVRRGIIWIRLTRTLAALGIMLGMLIGALSLRLVQLLS